MRMAWHAGRVRYSVAAIATLLVLSGCAGASSPSPVVSASGPVPAPSGGEVSQTVAPVRRPSPIETDLTGRVTPAPGLEVRLDKVESINAKAQAPGETSGPALAVTVTVSNATGHEFDPSALEIAVSDAKGKPGSGMTGPPASWLTGRVPSGSEASGVYVFATQGTARKPVTITVALAPGMPSVRFKG